MNNEIRVDTIFWYPVRDSMKFMASRLKHPMKRTVMYIKEDVALEFAEEMTDDFPSSELFILLRKLYRMIEYIEISNMHGIAYSIA